MGFSWSEITPSLRLATVSIEESTGSTGQSVSANGFAAKSLRIVVELSLSGQPARFQGPGLKWRKIPYHGNFLDGRILHDTNVFPVCCRPSETIAIPAHRVSKSFNEDVLENLVNSCLTAVISCRIEAILSYVSTPVWLSA